MKPNILFILADQFRTGALGYVGGWIRRSKSPVIIVPPGEGWACRRGRNGRIG
jgi:hypothetical protein